MNMRMLLLLRSIILGTGLVLLTGCSSFHRDWKAALAHPSPAHELAGPWEGEWRSQVNGHHGRLRCLAQHGTDGPWQARFHATYKILKFIPLSFSYTVDLTVQEQDGAFVFQGEEDLGSMAGGVYRYEGTVQNGMFHSTYQSSYDHGVFDMTRPTESASP